MPNISPWLHLVRLPNLLTVPGDPLAGFMLAGLAGAELRPAIAISCVATSLCLYSAGIISNDYFDFREDQKDRPTRPLPSGLIKPSAALALAGVVGLIGIFIAGSLGLWTLSIAIVLATNILLYNSILKKIPILGPLSMGLCRGLSLLLGAAATGGSWVTSHVVVIAASGLTLFIAAVTTIAVNETRRIKIGKKRWLPVIAIATCMILLNISRPLEIGTSIPAAMFSAIAVAWTWRCAVALSGTPNPETISKNIGNLLRGLLVIQAAFCAQFSWQGTIVGAGLIVIWPILSALSQRIKMS